MLEIIDRLFPYLIAFTIGACGSAFVFSLQGDARVAIEKKAHADDVARYEKELHGITAAAALADEKALADHRAQEGKIATLDEQLTKERQAHENDARTYAAALAAGAQRLRIPVTRCSASRNDVPAPAPAASVDDGGPAYADLDPAVAGRVFSVAADDQREIDKLKALQGYVCSVVPDAAACAAKP